MSLANAQRIARRELRGGLAGFRVFLACLALGVAAVKISGGLEDEIQVLVDTTAAQNYCADLDYDPESKLILVPTLYGNRLIAYEIDRKTQ